MSGQGHSLLELLRVGAGTAQVALTALPREWALGTILSAWGRHEASLAYLILSSRD